MNFSFFTQYTGLRFFIIGLLLAFLFLSSGFISSMVATTIQSATLSAKAADANGATLRVMSWNAFFLNKTPEAFIAEVATLHPDVIAIQELGQVMLDEIVAGLQDDYPYMALHAAKIPAGSAVLSRYPLTETAAPDYDVWHGCNCQIVTVDFAGELFTLINTHPWPPKVTLGGTGDWTNLFSLDTTVQDLIFNQLIRRIDDVTTPLLVVGDLNTMPFQPNVQRLKTQLTDAFGEVGHGAGYTFPAQATNHGLPPHPFMRLDYIFHDADWQTIAVWNGTILGSDHRYIMADLQFVPASVIR